MSIRQVIECIVIKIKKDSQAEISVFLLIPAINNVHLGDVSCTDGKISVRIKIWNYLYFQVSLTWDDGET